MLRAIHYEKGKRMQGNGAARGKPIFSNLGETLTIRRVEVMVMLAILSRPKQGKVIQFYVPDRFRPKTKWVAPALRGKVLQFPARRKKTA